MASANSRNRWRSIGNSASTSIACAANVWRARKHCSRKSEMGALLCFDMNNVRYLTSTHIGTWAQDKTSRFTLLPQNDEPILWDFGSAAQASSAALPLAWRTLAAGNFACCAEPCRRRWGARKMSRKKFASNWKSAACTRSRWASTSSSRRFFSRCRSEGIKVVDGQQLMSDARVIKTQDEISLLNTSAMMVDAAYDELYRAMKPGMRENEAVGLVSKVLYDLGSEYVEAVNAISGERCNPHPHVFSDRVLRPGDPVYYDILHSYMGYRTCYYRCFTIGYASHAMVDAYKRCRDYLDAAIELVRPGRTTAEIAAVWPKAQEFGFPDEEAAFALQYGHGIGLAIWEKPVISRLVSLDHPHDDQAGHGVCAGDFLAFDRWLERGAHRRRNRGHAETGHEVITRFPAEELAGCWRALLHGQRTAADDARNRSSAEPEAA